MIHSQNLARLSPAEREAFVAALTPREAAELPFLWEFWARPPQLLPDGDWVYWLPLGGRGCGKTRTGAEAVRRWAKTNAYVNIIGAAADDVRDVMVEGESGLINICPPDERPKFVAALTPREAAELPFLWEFWARPTQLLPKSDWVYWLPLGGRGCGKTRTGAEAVRLWAKTNAYVNIIGAAADDVRDVMVEGESGLISICPPDERPKFVAARNCLEWPNGARTLLFSAEAPERLRGKQHCKLWADELAAWRYPEAWDQAVFGLRLGDKPQAVITTTPRPTKLIRELLANPLTHATRATTYDNLANLPQSFIDRILRAYEGTRLGRQELDAELLLDTPGALWTRATLEAAYLAKPPALTRVVVAIDPPASSIERADECGVIVAGLSENGEPCVLADLSSQGDTPLRWASRAVQAARDFEADAIVAEVNNGGDMVETVIRQIDANVRVKSVRASRGKFTRAEPVAALYEQGRAKHVGVFAKLEDQMCLMTPEFDRRAAGFSPDRVDALVWQGCLVRLFSGGSGIPSGANV